MATRGPQAGPVKVYYKGLQPMIQAVGNLQKKLENLDMSAAVRGAAGVYQKQFDTQGAAHGAGWKPLSVYTQRIRQYRGFNPDSPILKQSGNLRKAAADYPAKFKGKSMSRTLSGGYEGGAQTTINIRASANRAIMTLSGAKVANNFGGRVTGYGWQTSQEHGLPRRPFWFINNEVREKAAEALVESFKSEWDRLA